MIHIPLIIKSTLYLSLKLTIKCLNEVKLIYSKCEEKKFVFLYGGDLDLQYKYVL